MAKLMFAVAVSVKQEINNKTEISCNKATLKLLFYKLKLEIKKLVSYYMASLELLFCKPA